MRTFAADEAVPADARGAAVALGNFDGVHRGHQAVVAAAAAHDRPLAAAVFEPHPRRFFKPEAPPFRLQSNGQRARALASLGVTALHTLRFDRAMADRSDEAFARDVLHTRIGAAHVAVGFDFRFGRNRVGDTQRLQDLGAQLGFSVDIVDAVDDARHAGKVSSSDIRTAVSDGDMARAADLLGRPWAIEGVVIDGMKRARGIGFPTANMALADYVRPCFGVYASRTDVGDGVWRAGVSNAGVKPTVGGVAEPLLETHVFDFAGDLYGRTVETQLITFLRPERKFDSFEALTAQIAADAAQARRLLA
ncbi:MAG: bifunctional riboflavin kinase/FAD synthetase [Hyphomonadaceae bacterium]|nr:bifunctional riboflavin kinase/FAD synthetase [Hyphomonadaceae bacterium]